MSLLFYDCQINSKDRQNRQHSVKTDESKLVLKQSFKSKHKTKERTLSLNATTARNLLFPKMI